MTASRRAAARGPRRMAAEPSRPPATRRRLFELPDGAGDRHRRGARGSSPSSSAASSRRPASSGRCSGCRVGSISALVAYLVAEAIGADRLLARAAAVPDVVAGLADRRRDGRRRRSAARRELVDITPMVDGYFGTGAHPGGRTRRRRGRCDAATSWPGMRMAVLYDRSVTWGGLVVGTGNKTESLIGYTTLFGDSACAFNPIGDLYKSQVRQLAGGASACPRRSSARRRRPTCGRARPTRARPASAIPSSTGSCSGDGRPAPIRRGAGRRSGFDPAMVERVDRMVAGGRVQAPGPADRQARAADGRRRLPLSAAASRLDGGYASVATSGSRRPAGCPTPGRAAAAVRRGDADREPRRRHAAGARGPARASPLIAAEDTRHSPPAARPLRDHDPHDQLPRPQRPGADWPSSLGHLAGGADLALVTDAGHAVGQRPGRRPRARRGPARAARVVPIPGPSAVLAALVASGSRRAALVVRGVPAAVRTRAPRAAGPDRRRRPGHDRVRGARPGRGDAARPGRGVRAGSARRRSVAS